LLTFFTLKDRANVVVAVQNTIVTMEVTQQRQEPELAYHSINPATGELLKSFPGHSDEQMMNALPLADKAIRALGSQAMVDYKVKFCNFCQHSIVVGQRWVREKIYDPRLTSQDATYRHFHAEPLEGQNVSCWERHGIEGGIAQHQ
jgi:hypothetical protein